MHRWKPESVEVVGRGSGVGKRIEPRPHRSPESSLDKPESEYSMGCFWQLLRVP